MAGSCRNPLPGSPGGGACSPACSQRVGAPAGGVARSASTCPCPKTVGEPQDGHWCPEQSVHTLAPQLHIPHSTPHSPSQRLHRRQRPHRERLEWSAVGSSPSASSRTHGACVTSSLGQVPHSTAGGARGSPSPTRPCPARGWLGSLGPAVSPAPGRPRPQASQPVTAQCSQYTAPHAQDIQVQLSIGLSCAHCWQMRT